MNKYDIFGQLIQEDANGTTTKYAVDGWNPAKAGATGTSNFDVWATFTSGGSLITRQIQGDGIDQHLAFVTSSNAYWYLTDHLGSTRATINNSGTVQDSIAYDAYGNITSQSNASAALLYTYTGRELDVETGLQYNRARWYDPSTGRWISQDPLGFDAGDSNLYRYVNNAPTRYTDPSGRVVHIALLVMAAGYAFFASAEWADAPVVGSTPVARPQPNLIVASVEGSTLALAPASQAIRGAMAFGMGADAAYQEADRLQSWRQGERVAPFNPGQSLTAGVQSGAFGPPLANAPRLAYPLIASGAYQAAGELADGQYERAAVSIALTGGGTYLSRSQFATDLRRINSLLRLPQPSGGLGGSTAQTRIDTSVLNLGSGSNPMPRAVNVDQTPGNGVNVVASAGRLPFSNGQFAEVNAINPYGFQPVSAEIARVLRPGGLLRVTGTQNNPWARPLSAAQARAAGFELVETTPIQPAHEFGVQARTDGTPIPNTSNSTTTVYRRLQQ